MLNLVYTSAVVLGAALLFLVQPMVAKMLLPELGGSPSVWNACMAFFQAALLVGYLYAHVLSRRIAPRRQILVHAMVLVVPLALLPIRVPTSGPPGDASPVAWLLQVLLVSVGAPFAVVAATGPLLQRWYADAHRAPQAHPYFLFAASNLGSLAGLLLYPFLLEPRLPLTSPEGSLLRGTLCGWSQSGLWALGYVALAGLIVACGSSPPKVDPAAAPAASVPDESGHAERVGWSRRFGWLLLAFVPSSLMLGATQFITTDVAAVPLLWVLPLSLYLLTFAIAFSDRWRIPSPWASGALVVLSVATAATLWLFVRPSPRLAIPLHLATLFVACLVCHGRLSSVRPHPSRLTEYYLAIAAGGCLGGAFNALLAPRLFTSVVEYPAALALACFLRPEVSRGKAGPPRLRTRVLDVALPALLAMEIVGLHLALPALGNSGGPALLRFEAAVACLLCLLLSTRPLRFGLGFSVLLVAAWIPSHALGTTLYAERTFFGVSQVKRIVEPPPGTAASPGSPSLERIPLNVLVHGTTFHGSQLQHPQLRYRATSYYHISGPIGGVFRAYRRTSRLDQVAIVGLGAGTLAVYGEPGQRFTFYEIDPAVVRIARDDRFFTYLRDCRAEVKIVVGDGRLSLAAAPDGEYGLIVIDAFSSDAVPVHMITRDAIAVYLRKLRPDGVLALHLTSQWFDLRPVVSAIAADLSLPALSWEDVEVTPRQAVERKDRSLWAVLSRDPATLDPLRAEGGWTDLAPPAGVRPAGRFLWTDESSSVLGALRRR